jgi:exonuclease III
MAIKILILLSMILSFDLHALTLMSYNVENLFDAEDDPGKDDETYLPLKHKSKKACKEIKNPYYRGECEKTDWTEAKINQKLENISEVVGSYTQRPDFLAVIEIENDSILKRLGAKLGYQNFISTHSPDERGVDVGLYFQKSKDISLVSSDELILKEGVNKPTRNILIGHFLYKKKDLFLLVNHWPSQGAPTAVRLAVAKKVREKLEELKKKFPKAYFVATGDFNTLDREYPSPFDELKRDNLLVDTRKYLDRDSVQGSYFYGRQMSWNLLDRFFISPELDKKKIAFKIWNPNMATGVYEFTHKDSPYRGSRVVGIPKRFDHKKKNLKKLGYSDHFPVILEIKD